MWPLLKALALLSYLAFRLYPSLVAFNKYNNNNNLKNFPREATIMAEVDKVSTIHSTSMITT